nr:dynein regulatory complex subunit 6 isoform X5 [Pelodiscus sinensis]|eukprot:XP_014436318.1 dynein regulatory complex subunit 6 isoform X5 [Pelodiscus sinensis]
MSSLRDADPGLRAYFKRHSLLDVYETLLCGVFIMCPEDPLKFLEEKIREIMVKGLDGILWDACIDSSLRPELKRISETYLHILFGLNDEQLMTEELCEKAWNFYSNNLKKLYFHAWMHYCLLQKKCKALVKQKMAFAGDYYDTRITRVVVQKWRAWVQFRKDQIALAAMRIQKVFNDNLKKIILRAWHAEAQSSAKTKAYFERLVKGDQEECFEKQDYEQYSSSETVKDEMSNIQERAILQIFHYIDLIDLARCAQVSRSWMLLTQASSIWTDIDFSSVKHKVQDKTVEKILKKWRPYVIRLNLRACSALHWPSFKSISECKNLQDLNVSECKGLNDESMRLISEGCPALLYLNLSYTDITNGTLRLLSRISDAGLRPFLEGSSGAKLRELNLTNCIHITDASLMKIAQRCHNLTYLNIRYCESVTDGGIEALGYMTSLMSIDISGTTVSDMSLVVLGHVRRMKELSVSECRKITDLGIQRFCQGAKDLEYCDVSYCFQLTNETVKALAFNCRQLTSLNIAGCHKMTDLCIQYLSGVCHYLHFLDISGCVHLTDKTLKYLWKGCTQLRILKMLYCKNITKQAVLKYSVKLEKQEYNDADPPSWLGYDSAGSVLTLNKKSRPGSEKAKSLSQNENKEAT